MPSKSPLYTIGYSNHSFEIFLQLLQKHGITTLVDVRSKPGSRNPAYTSARLPASLRAAAARPMRSARRSPRTPSRARPRISHSSSACT